jgi:hypothetical protein
MLTHGHSVADVRTVRQDRVAIFYILMLYLMQQFAAVPTGHLNIGKDDGRGLSLEDFSRWRNPGF